MANKDTPEVSDFFIEGRPLSRAIFKKPEHVADVLKYFGAQRRPTLRKIIHELDMMAIDFWIAHKNAHKNKPLKFEEAVQILERAEKSLLRIKRQWFNELRPLHSAIIALRIKMIQPGERKQKADAAMASINLDLVATTLLGITGELRDPKKYAAAHHQPHGRSIERAFIWQPLLLLMEKYHVKPGQHGSFVGAIGSLHNSLGIDPPSEGAVKKMLHDLRQGERSKAGKGYGTAKKSPNA